MNNKHCKFCKEPLPPFALHFSNEAAINNGYCSWFCTLAALGDEKALKVVEKYRKKGTERPANALSQSKHSRAKGEENRDQATSEVREKKSVLERILSDDPQGEEG